ncbi:vacuolar protein 8-like [Pyrus communis]|uniref:vacuolar protein 8-like n=1 Tax=Pyrus communis TaxID=23211 RepID=UPI0035BF9B87
MRATMGKEEKQGAKETEQSQTSSESSSGQSSLRRTIESITSLISLSYSIKIFSAKWKTIRTKLEDLSSGLEAVENCEASENAILSGIVSGICQTVNECHDLARRCVDLSYSGKLLMQSDLDILSARLDLHARNLSDIYNAGVLTRRFAIVVSRPGNGACRDDMRFYVRDLMTRMKIGDAEMKRQALLNLHEALVEDDKYVKVVVEHGEIVYVLASFLDFSHDVRIQELSAKIVSVISGFGSYKVVLIGAGIIAPLIRVLECGSVVGKEEAAKSLQRLTENSDNGWSISAHGGVTALLKLCSGGDGSEIRAELVGPACGALKNLVGIEEIKRFMVEEGVISTFIGLARSKDEVLQINSIEFLQNIASGDEAIRVMVSKEGGIQALVRVLASRSVACSCKVRETAMRAIENLCFRNANSISLLIKYGFVDQLMFFLQHGEVSIQELALKVSIRMCGKSEEAKKAMGDANFMTELVKFLDSKSFEVREMAAEALSNMVRVPKNRKRFVQDDRNMCLLLQRFDPKQVNSGNKKLLFSILMSLTSCNSGRRKIAHSGYLKNIEKLAEDEVSDAKTLVKKLSTNRFRSMLSGIWH